MKRKLFKDSDAFRFLHATKNQNIDFSNVHESSPMMVYWQCDKDERHVWEQRISSRTKQGYGCPYCSGNRTLPEESLAALFPDIVAELHPNKNPEFDPTTHSPGSNKEVVWVCENGHEWKTRVEHRTKRKNSRCPVCRKLENSLEFRFPELMQEWHPTENGDLNPKELTPSSHKKVWWRCRKNIQHPNWQRTINARTRDDKGCPECAKKKEVKKLAGSYSDRKNIKLPLLSQYSPELSKQWHPLKNQAKIPENFTAGSEFKAWWLCPNCEHEWQATICNRARKKRGCPNCPRKPSRNNVKERSLASFSPDLARQWHPKKNGDLTPDKVTYGSARKVWWQCEKDARHVWEEVIVWRTKRKSHNCKICDEEANTLLAVYPEVAAEWHPTKNGDLKPSEVTKASGKIVWWQCSVNPEHEWQADVRNRTKNKSNCKHCAQEKTGLHLRYPGIDVDPKDIETLHIFKNTISNLKMLFDYEFEDNKRLIQPVYRMIYSTIITALESYLSDSFRNKVEGNSERIVKIINNSRELQDKKYSIEQIVDWHNNVEAKILQFLADIIWHNLFKVRHLYNEVLGISFPENTSIIAKAVNIRHDLVHRNGRTKKGDSHILSKEIVTNLIFDTEVFVDEIQNQLVRV